MDDFETTALGLWLKMHPARAVEVRRVTACELDRLLGSKLGMEAGSPVDVRSFVSEAGYRVDALEGPIRYAGSHRKTSRTRPRMEAF